MTTFIFEIGTSFARDCRAMNYRRIGVCAKSRKDAYEYLKQQVPEVIVECELLATCSDYCVYYDNEPDTLLDDGDMVFFK